MLNQVKPKLFIIGLCFALVVLTGYGFWHRSQSIETFNMRGKTVVIDAGHGGKDIGCTSAGPLAEKDITLLVAKDLAHLLQQQGAKVILTRNSDQQPGDSWYQKLLPSKTRDSLETRLNIATTNDADAFISLHVNSSARKERAGTVVYYHDNNKQAQQLAANIQQQLRQIPDMNKRTNRTRNYYLLSHLKMPAAVVELGYLSNPKDQQHLSNPKLRIKIAQAICNGTVKYLNGHKLPIAEANSEVPVNNAKSTPEDQAVPSLYFVPKSQTRLFMAEEKVTTADNLATRSVAEQAELTLQQLFNGPQKRDSFIHCIPPGLQLSELKISEGSAAVDLGINGVDTNSIGSEDEWTAVSSIVYTLLEFPDIEKVQLLVNGQQQKTLAGHIDISKPLTRNNLALIKIAGGIMEGKKAKVAIVIDDFGQGNPEGVKEMLSTDRPLTAAVMPKLAYSVVQAERAACLGYEVIVHLPMQPRQGKASWLGPGAITANLTPDQIRQVTRSDFSQIPYANGFNNHMGSLITSQERLIRPVLEIAKEKGFFVLDSKTDGDSKLVALSQSMAIPYTQRDVFLDDTKDVAHIKKQLELLANVALENGSAIGIGHVGLGGKKTAQAIKEMIPVMEAKGIEFVYLSELVHG